MTKVTRLEVKDLGPIREATVDDRAPVTILLGPNESGKTTLLEALGVLYFGTRAGLDVKDNAKLVREGAQGWTVAAVIDGQTLRATRSQRPLREECERALGDPRVFRALLDVGSFLESRPMERKSLLADLTAYDTMGLAQRLQGLGAAESVVQDVEAGLLKRAHSRLTDSRRAADRVLKDLRARADTPVADAQVDTKGGPRPVSSILLETVEQGLEKLRKRRSEVEMALAARRQHEHLLKRAEEARTELDDLTSRGSWTGEDEAHLTQIQRDLEDERRKAMEASAQIAEQTRQRGPLAELLKRGGACPTCGRSVEGEAAKAIRDALFRLDQDSQRARTTQEIAAKEAKALEDLRARAVARRDQARQGATVRRRLEEIVAQAEKGEMPPEPQVALDALHADEARLTSIRDARRDYEMALRLKKEAQQRIDPAIAQRDRLREMEQLADPTQLEDEDGATATFRTLLVSVGHDMGVEVTLRPDYDLEIDGRPVALAADSARIRAGLTCSIALSVLTGLGLAFLDRFESLDGANRKRALGALKSQIDAGGLSWVLVAAVKENPSRGAAVPWLAWASLDHGTLTYLEN